MIIEQVKVHNDSRCNCYFFIFFAIASPGNVFECLEHERDWREYVAANEHIILSNISAYLESHNLPDGGLFFFGPQTESRYCVHPIDSFKYVSMGNVTSDNTQSNVYVTINNTDLGVLNIEYKIHKYVNPPPSGGGGGMSHFVLDKLDSVSLEPWINLRGDTAWVKSTSVETLLDRGYLIEPFVDTGYDFANN